MLRKILAISMFIFCDLCRRNHRLIRKKWAIEFGSQGIEFGGTCSFRDSKCICIRGMVGHYLKRCSHCLFHFLMSLDSGGWLPKISHKLVHFHWGIAGFMSQTLFRVMIVIYTAKNPIQRSLLTFLLKPKAF